LVALIGDKNDDVRDNFKLYSVLLNRVYAHEYMVGAYNVTFTVGFGSKYRAFIRERGLLVLRKRVV
jgi:hypothetical protein